MKLTHLTRFALVCLVFSGSGAWAQGTDRRPILEVSENGWDFGERLQGAKERKVITLRNKGNWPLTIKKLSKTCGCVEPSLAIRTIPAGSTADLVLMLDTTRGEGEIRKFVILETNDPERPKVSLPMNGTINPVWWITTRELLFGEVTRGAANVKTFRVSVRKGHEVAITNLLASTDEIVLTKKPFREDDGTHGWDIEVVLSNRDVGYFEGMIAVQTDFKPIFQRALRVMADVKSLSRVTPQDLALGSIEAGQTKTVTVTVEKELGDGMKIVEVFCKDPQVSSRIVEKEKGKRFEIEISFTPAKGQTSIRGFLTVVIDEPGRIEVGIGYRGRVLLP